jgi:DNA adenine methylase
LEKLSIPTFIKWAGGKTQLLNQFEPFFPVKISRYFEPFVGSGAVFFYIKQTCKPDYCMISDNNQNLINLYIAVRDNLKDLLELLKKYKKEHTRNPKEYYYQQRKEFNKTNNTLIKSALLIYLNKTCYNGLYRVNSKDEFNVPMGSYKNPSIVQPKILERASELLQNVVIKVMDFKKIIDFAESGDFIYFDPPYYPLSITSSFTSYQKETFLDEEQKLLANVFQKLDESGCKVMLSNSDSPFIHDLYSEYEADGHLYTVKAKRMISCNAEGRKPINEVVVTNYKPRINTQKTLSIKM